LSHFALQVEPAEYPGGFVSGSHIEFWVNDQQIFILDDNANTFSTGALGFGAIYGSQASQVVFSALQVWMV
jgi:hypothetical protein